MALCTRVAQCDPASISFQSSSDQPVISSPETLRALKLASHHLVDLQLPVAFPTETVYGLGAIALDALAVSRIFSTKGRPSDNPLIVHVSSFTMLHSLLPKDYEISEPYRVLMKHFWPGPLTLLFPSNPAIIPPIITANQPTVAIRMPSHPVARGLIALTKAPIAAPSANSSGKPSPTRPEHVLHDLQGKVSLILDGGACGVGLESTVVDGLNEDGDIRVLRPGGVTVENIETVFQQELNTRETIPKVLVYRRHFRDEVIEQAPTTPGMKYRHYSPSVPVVLLLTLSPPPIGVAPAPARDFLASLSDYVKKPSGPVKVGIMTPADSPLAQCVLPTGGIEWRRYLLGPTAQPAITAHRLFDGLLRLEGEGVDVILIEEIKEEMEGLAVMNRVKAAAAESRWIRFQ